MHPNIRQTLHQTTPQTDPRGGTPMKSRIDKETAVNRLVNSFTPLRCKLLPLDRDMHNFDLRIVGAGGKEVDIPLDVSPYQLRDVKRLEALPERLVQVALQRGAPSIAFTWRNCGTLSA